MYAPIMNDILFHLLPARPGQLIDARAWADMDNHARGEIQRAAEKALNRSLPAMLASDAIEGRQVYAQARGERREMLIALLLGALCAGPDRYITQLIDVAWAICEESSWRDSPGLKGFALPEADESALETASLLAWTYQLAGEYIEKPAPEVNDKIIRELARRVFAPLTARETPAWAIKKDGRALTRASKLLSAFILADTDDRRRWLGIRRCLLQLDELFKGFPPGGYHPLGLEAWQADAEALSDAATLTLMATGGEADARDDRKFQRLCDYPVSAHLANGCFVNPDGEMKPRLTGATVFRIGECANNKALKRLGAALGGEYDGASATARILDALTLRAFRAEPAVFPKRARVCLPGAMLLSARESGFCAAVTGGSMSRGHIDAGNLYLFRDGRAVFSDLSAAHFSADMHSLPSVNGYQPARGFGGAKDAEARFEDAFTYLSINLAPGFPKEAGVISWQRTVMLTPMEARARVIEAFDLESAAEEVRFRFIAPYRPQPDGENAYIIGNTRFTWEHPMRSIVEDVKDGYRLTVFAPKGGTRGNYAFIASPAER